MSEDRWTEGRNDGHPSEEMFAALAAARPLSRQARAHLAGCEECQEEWALLSGLQAEVLGQAALEPVAPPPALRAALLQQARGTGISTGLQPAPPQAASVRSALSTQPVIPPRQTPATPAGSWLTLDPIPWLLGTAMALILLSLWNTVQTLRRGTIDAITEPLSAQPTGNSRGVRAFVMLTNWLFPALAAVMGLVIFLITR